MFFSTAWNSQEYCHCYIPVTYFPALSAICKLKPKLTNIKSQVKDLRKTSKKWWQTSFSDLLSNVRIRKHVNTGWGMRPPKSFHQVSAFWPVGYDSHSISFIEIDIKIEIIHCIAQIKTKRNWKLDVSLLYLRNTALNNGNRLIGWSFKTEWRSSLHALFSSYNAFEVFSCFCWINALLPFLVYFTDTLMPFNIIVKWIWLFFPHINVLFNWNKTLSFLSLSAFCQSCF